MKASTLFTLFFLIVNSFSMASDTLKMAFGSCNRQNKTQDYWEQVASLKPHRWIWLGDNIYADTEDMGKMKDDYNRQLMAPEYVHFRTQVSIDGVWDDHDYGKNDAGAEYGPKNESRSLYINFLQPDSVTRQEILSRGGTYYHRMLRTDSLNICLVFIDTRWFRSPLQKSTQEGKKYTSSDTGTVLGKEQWLWLEKLMNQPETDLFIMASSIQLLSNDHAWEKWGNFPHERERMLRLIGNKNVLVLSGDRHITEFSVMQRPEAAPLYDFTSSGLTHTWKQYEEEFNALRIGRLFNVRTFGSLEIWKDKTGINVAMSMYEIGRTDAIQRLVAYFPKK